MTNTPRRELDGEPSPCDSSGATGATPAGYAGNIGATVPGGPGAHPAVALARRRATSHGVLLSGRCYVERWAGDPAHGPRAGLPAGIPRAGFLRGQRGRSVEVRADADDTRVLLVCDAASGVVLGALTSDPRASTSCAGRGPRRSSTEEADR